MEEIWIKSTDDHPRTTIGIIYTEAGRTIVGDKDGDNDGDSDNDGDNDGDGDVTMMVMVKVMVIMTVMVM